MYKFIDPFAERNTKGRQTKAAEKRGEVRAERAGVPLIWHKKTDPLRCVPRAARESDGGKLSAKVHVKFGNLLILSSLFWICEADAGAF